MGSPPRSLNNTDWSSVGKAYTAGLGLAIITYTAGFISNQDFGSLTPIITVALPVLVTAITQWWKDNTK